MWQRAQVVLRHGRLGVCVCVFPAFLRHSLFRTHSETTRELVEWSQWRAPSNKKFDTVGCSQSIQLSHASMLAPTYSTGCTVLTLINQRASGPDLHDFVLVLAKQKRKLFVLTGQNTIAKRKKFGFGFAQNKKNTKSCRSSLDTRR